jgi:hypothetical protein
MFCGRTALLKRIGTAIDERRSVSVVGDWRVGKTSLLQRLKEAPRLAVGRIAMVSGEDEAGSSHSAFVEALAGRRTSDDPDDAAGALSAWCASRPAPPVVLVDEFDGMVARFDHRFFERLRGMLGRLVLVLASRRELDLIYADIGKTSPFYNRLESVWVGLLEPDAAAALIAKGRPIATPADERLATEWAGRHPFYLQLICRFLLNARIDGGETADAVEAFRTVADARLRDVMRTLSAAERDDLAAATAGHPGSRRSLKVRGLIDEHGMPFGRVLTEFIREQDTDV